MRFCFLSGNDYVETEMTLKEGANIESFMNDPLFKRATRNGVVNMSSIDDIISNSLDDDAKKLICIRTKDFFDNYDFKCLDVKSVGEFKEACRFNTLNMKNHSDSFSAIARSVIPNTSVLSETGYELNISETNRKRVRL